MARNRKRKKHHQQTGAGSAPKAKVPSRYVWSILMAVFAVVIGISAAGINILVLAICAVGGALIGYFIGRSMMRSLKDK